MASSWRLEARGLNAHSTISEAVSKVLVGHESRSPWKNCSCGWRGPTITLSSIVRKGLFQKHVADAVADVLMKMMRGEERNEE